MRERGGNGDFLRQRKEEQLKKTRGLRFGDPFALFFCPRDADGNRTGLFIDEFLQLFRRAVIVEKADAFFNGRVFLCAFGTRPTLDMAYLM